MEHDLFLSSGGTKVRPLVVPDLALSFLRCLDAVVWREGHLTRRNLFQLSPNVLFWNRWRKKMSRTSWPRFGWKTAIKTEVVVVVIVMVEVQWNCSVCISCSCCDTWWLHTSKLIVRLVRDGMAAWATVDISVVRSLPICVIRRLRKLSLAQSSDPKNVQ